MKIANWETVSEISCHSLRLSINLETQVDDIVDYFLQIILFSWRKGKINRSWENDKGELQLCQRIMRNYFFSICCPKLLNLSDFLRSCLAQNVAFSVLCGSHEKKFTMGITEHVVI